MEKKSKWWAERLEEIDDCRLLESYECKIDSEQEKVEISFYCID